MLAHKVSFSLGMIHVREGLQTEALKFHIVVAKQVL